MPEVLILYACDRLMEEIVVAFDQRKQTFKERIAENPMFKGVPVKELKVIVEQIKQVVDRVKQRAVNGLYASGAVSAAVYTAAKDDQ